MKTWQYFWRLIRYRPRFYAMDITFATIFFGLQLLTGLILRGYFNGLTGEDGQSLALQGAVLLQLVHKFFRFNPQLVDVAHHCQKLFFCAIETLPCCGYDLLFDGVREFIGGQNS